MSLAEILAFLQNAETNVRTELQKLLDEAKAAGAEIGPIEAELESFAAVFAPKVEAEITKLKAEGEALIVQYGPEVQALLKKYLDITV